MKHRPVFVLLFLVALSLAGMGQENPGRQGDIPAKQPGKTTDEPAHFYVVGEVVNPGEYVMSEPLTLTDAIALAGGLEPGASRYGYLHRRIKEGEVLVGSNQAKLLENPEITSPDGEVVKIDLRLLMGGDGLKINMQMKAGDVLVVPRTKKSYYVVGDVLNPGAFEISASETVHVSEAIANAGGPSKTAKVSRGMLIRYDEKGERQQIQFDFGAILSGDKDDFEIFLNDIVFIPGSHAKTLGYGAMPIIIPETLNFKYILNDPSLSDDWP